MKLSEVVDYRPIPRGGLWLVTGILAGLALEFLFNWAFPSESDRFLLSDWLLAPTVMFIGILFQFGPRKYWRRNVKGCSIAVYRDSTGECQVEGPHTLEIIRGVKSWRQISLVLPLGGWFNRAHIMCGEGYVGRAGVDVNRMLSKWRVKLVDIHAQAIIVQLSDARGDRVTVSAKDALEILERFAAGLKAWTNTWDAVVSHGLIAERVLTKERDEARQQLGQEIGRANEGAWACAALLMHVIDRLDATKRFIKSRQAREIREELVRELHQRLPSGDSRREKYGLPMTMGCAIDSQPAVAT